MSRLARQVNRQDLTPDTQLTLWELDFSKLMGSPIGTEQYIRRFVPDAYVDGEGVVLDGKPYDPLWLRATGFDWNVEKPPPRPTLTVGNGNGLITALIDSVGGDLTGARVVRRRIFKRYLDGEDEADPMAQFEPDLWTIERTGQENRYSIEFELSTPVDVEVDLPLRTVEPDFCSFEYLSAECGWDNSIQPWYDADDEVVGTQQEDQCGLRYRSCKLRFAHASPSRIPQPLRFAGYRYVRRTVR